GVACDRTTMIEKRVRKLCARERRAVKPRLDGSRRPNETEVEKKEGEENAVAQPRLMRREGFGRASAFALHQIRPQWFAAFGRGSPSDFMIASCSASSLRSGRLKSMCFVSASHNGFTSFANCTGCALNGVKSGVLVNSSRRSVAAASY